MRQSYQETNMVDDNATAGGGSPDGVAVPTARSAQASTQAQIDRRSFLQALSLLAFCFSFSTPFAKSAWAFEGLLEGSYRIVYKLHGGVSPAGQTLEIMQDEVIPVERLLKPNRKGYKFVGWFVDDARKKPALQVRGQFMPQSRTLHAKWKIKKYKIKYKLKGGKAVLKPPKRYTVKTDTIKPLPPVKDGCRFAGWYSDKALMRKRTSIKRGSTGKVTLRAKWVGAEYWDDHLDEKCRRVNDLARDLENPMPSFVFVSDVHLPKNAFVSPSLVQRVVHETDIGMVVFGGDAIDYCPDKDEAIRALRYVRRAFDSAELHFVHGNHDSNMQSEKAKRRGRITNAEFIHETASVGEVREGKRLYYYRDDERYKVRYLFLDSGAPNSAYIDTRQLAWVKKRVLELDEEWTVLVFIHQFFCVRRKNGVVVGLGYDKSGVLVRNLLDDIYDDSRARIAGVFSGHCHGDCYAYSRKGYPMISSECDAHRSSHKPLSGVRRVGTTDEQAFDIVTIDTANEKIYLTRVGKGSDRVFSYGRKASGELQAATGGRS